MFECDSDFEVDEEFLGNIANSELSLQNESSRTLNQDQSTASVHESRRITNSDLQTINYNKACGSSKEWTVGNVPSSSPLQSFTSNCNNTVQRKFPGPAGLLPERRYPASPSVLSPNNVNTSSSEKIQKHTKEQQLFQTWQSLLESSTWKKFLIDFEAKEILDNINIRHIKEKASAKLLVCKKVPFLAAILHEVDLSPPDPYITLCDQTGLISGALHRDAWKQYGDALVTGCVLILRNLGVLSLGINPHKNQHYLNITSKNLALLYTSHDGDVTVTSINPFENDEISNSLKDWLLNTAPTASPLRPSKQNEQRLFTSCLSPQSSISDRMSPMRNLQFSPQISVKTPQSSIPLSKACTVQRKRLNCEQSFVAKRWSPMNSPVQRTDHPLRPNKQNSNLDVRDTSAILNLLSKSDQNLPTRSCINSISTHNDVNLSTNNTCDLKKFSNCFQQNSNTDRSNIASNRSNINNSDLNKKANVVSLETLNKNKISDNKSLLDQPFNLQLNDVSRCRSVNKFNFDFSPKRPRTALSGNNGNGDIVNKFSDTDKRNENTLNQVNKHCDNFTYSNANSSCNKEMDEQWEVQSLLSSIDADSFFEEF